jgi:hypothetical protein
MSILEKRKRLMLQKGRERRNILRRARRHPARARTSAGARTPSCAQQAKKDRVALKAMNVHLEQA